MKITLLSTFIMLLACSNLSLLQAQKVGSSGDSTVSYRAIETADWEQYSEGLQAVLLETRDSIRTCFDKYEVVAKGFALVSREKNAGRGKEEIQFTEEEQAAFEASKAAQAQLDDFIKELVSILFMEMGAKTHAYRAEIVEYTTAIYEFEDEQAKEVAPFFILKSVIYLLEQGDDPADEPLSHILTAMAEKWS